MRSLSSDTASRFAVSQMPDVRLVDRSRFGTNFANVCDSRPPCFRLRDESIRDAMGVRVLETRSCWVGNGLCGVYVQHTI